MLTYIMVGLAAAVPLAACAALAGYALGGRTTFRRIRGEQAATERLAAHVRRFVIAHLPRTENQEEVVVSVDNLERLHELADQCDQTSGQPLPPMHLTRRVLKASANRRSGRLTARLAA
jgi:hypothetical protein